MGLKFEFYSVQLHLLKCSAKGPGKHRMTLVECLLMPFWLCWHQGVSLTSLALSNAIFAELLAKKKKKKFLESYSQGKLSLSLSVWMNWSIVPELTQGRVPLNWWQCRRKRSLCGDLSFSPHCHLLHFYNLAGISRKERKCNWFLRIFFLIKQATKWNRRKKTLPWPATNIQYVSHSRMY